MNHSWFTTLFEYDLWASRRMISAVFGSALKEHPRAKALLGHIIQAQRIWLHRVQGTSENTGIDLWPIWDETTCMEQADFMHQQWTKALSSLDLTQLISYSTSTGQSFKSSVGEILHHIILHGQHHRAQIALHLSQHGVAAPATDFIYYSRK